MQRLCILLVILTMLPAACAPMTPLQPTPPAPTETPTPPDDALAAETAVQEAAASLLKVPAHQITVASSEAVEWPDGCLGVQRLGVMCTAVVTPGFRIVVEAGGQEYEYHTNRAGSVVMLASGASLNTTSIENQAIVSLARALSLSAEEITVVSVTSLMWPDACLGIARPEIACAMVETPGALVVLEANGLSYEYHTNLDGSVAISADFLLVWHREGGIVGFCDTLIVSLDGKVTASNCRTKAAAEATLEATLSPEERAQFDDWLTTFGTVEIAVTDPAVADAMSTTLILYGAGSEKPTAVDQQALMQFAQTLYERAQK